ncbi:MAG: hypothetical protein H6505_03385 [Calditrichaeota bacterium]|nr:hypothetical protein [Calditrichota bacterium]
MATSFTPGLRVSETTLITKDRILPLRGNVTVNVGEHMAAEQIVASTDLPGNVTPLNAANLLGVLPGDVRGALIIKEGDKIEKDQIIAESKSFFGLFKNKLKSPITGSLESISEVTGQLILRDPPIPVEIESYIEGRVTKIFPQEGVEVQAVGTFIQGIFGIGGETHGAIHMIANSPDELTDEHKIPAECKRKILVGGSLATFEAVKKAIAGGASALVVGGFDSFDLKKLLGYEQGVAITGGEQIGLTLVLTEGFGKISMAGRTFDLLKRNEGQKASVSGATQIRAGVMRPEIIIAKKDVTHHEEDSHEPAGLETGDVVRIIREPWFGKIGTVEDLPPELTALDTEAKVRVLKVKLEGSSEVVLLPRANIEKIEA